MNNWLLSVLLGVLSIILGGVALVYPFGASFAVEIFVAWSFIFLGIIVFFSIFTGNQSNGKVWTAILGILMFITGIVMLRNPMAGIMALSSVVGVMAIALGVIKFFAGFKIRETSLKWLTIISGVASVILGILIFGNLQISLGILLGAELIFDGVALIALAIARKSGGVEATS